MIETSNDDVAVSRNSGNMPTNRPCPTQCGMQKASKNRVPFCHNSPIMRVFLTKRPRTFFVSTVLASIIFAAPSSTAFSQLSPAHRFSFCSAMSNSAIEHNFVTPTNSQQKSDPLLPTMIVFDLDDCLWSPEMYTLHAKPSIPIEGDLTPQGVPSTGVKGVVGMQVPPRGPTVKLFSGARKVLYELATNPKYKGIKIAAASSSEEPSFSYACLNGIEVLPGLTMRQMFHYDEIGRTGKLSPDKRTHFRELQKASGVAFEEMLFFDDCNWGDHCATVTRAFGVVSQRTPSGMQYSEFEEGLERYRKEALNRQAE